MGQFLPEDYEVSTEPDEPVGYSLKALRLIAQNIGDSFNGTTIVETLSSIGIPENKINYPNTKWKTVFEVLQGAANGSITVESKNKKGLRAPITGDDLILRIIGEFLHPLTHNADESKAAALAEKVKRILKYDGLTLAEEGGQYSILTRHDVENISDNLHTELQYDWYDKEERRKQQLELLHANAKKIAQLKSAYRMLIEVVEVFFEDSSRPTEGLNEAYVRLKNYVSSRIKDLRLDNPLFGYSIQGDVIPFDTLFNAEAHFKKKGVALHWDVIRPEMFSVYSDLQKLRSETDPFQEIVKPETSKSLQAIITRTREERRGQIGLNNLTNVPVQKTEFYITKNQDDFWYKGHRLKVSKHTNYYQAFAALYAKLPEGGEVSYKDLGVEIMSRRPKTKRKSADEMRKFIQSNLTDKSNGFLRMAHIPETEDNGKPLIEVVRSSGLRFNNKAG